jgi:hypothetical protein
LRLRLKIGEQWIQIGISERWEIINLNRERWVRVRAADWWKGKRPGNQWE